MGNLVEHAKREFLAAGYVSVNETNKWMQENVIALLRVFADQGHSGSSAPHCVALFEKLARFEPLVPLTGEDSEWMEVTNGTLQNVRCSHVFKEGTEAYDIRGRIFREPNGNCYINRDSRVPVTFPYTPTSEYVDVEA